uniref:F-box protein 36a n=1 Tax=Oncorhynchus mykiss TaxID=8022 RepID=A0A8C7U3Z0_ONCMY
MASLHGKKLFEINGQGPPPTIYIVQLTVIWRSWKISLRIEFKGAAPGENKKTHDDHLHDSSLCHGNFDYLECLPNDLLLQILAFLELKDVALLAQTTKRFHKLCNSPEFWEQTVRGHCDKLTPDMEALANATGWRKIFFAFNTKENQQGSKVAEKYTSLLQDVDQVKQR